MADQPAYDPEAILEFRRELLALIAKDQYQAIAYPVILELLSFAGVMMWNGVQQTPAMYPRLRVHLDQLCEFVETAPTGSALEFPFQTFH